MHPDRSSLSSSHHAARRRACVLHFMSYTFDHRLQGELLNRFPLPAIRDANIRTSVRSRSTRSSRRHHSDGYENASFELLESLGDTLIATAIGKAVYGHIKHLDSASPGLFTAYRSLLQSNATFAQIALVYDLGAQLEPPFPLTFAHRADLNDTVRKNLGNAFEAHFGGLHVDGQGGTADLWLENVFRYCASGRISSSTTSSRLLRSGVIRSTLWRAWQLRRTRLRKLRNHAPAGSTVSRPMPRPTTVATRSNARGCVRRNSTSPTMTAPLFNRLLDCEESRR